MQLFSTILLISVPCLLVICLILKIVEKSILKKKEKEKLKNHDDTIIDESVDEEEHD